jgi:methionyl aminopeptidase
VAVPVKNIELKSSAEIRKMRRAGILLRQVLDEVTCRAVPGIMTVELDQLAKKIITDAGAVPAFLGYRGFPATLCISINEQVVHGIPSRRRLVEGDIASIDCGLILDGYYADAAVTVAVGKISDTAENLCRVTRESLQLAISLMVPGTRLGTLSAAVQEYVEGHGFSVVRDYTGHGIGREMHEPPQVPNHGTPDTGLRFKPGLVLALEPMVNVGTWRTRTLEDNWTVVAADGSLSAHFEDTVAITEDGPVVLTAREN